MIRFLLIGAGLLVACLVVVPGLLIAYVLLASPPWDLCGNKLLEEVPSPEGGHKAVAFERNCGATTSFSTQVSVLPADSGKPQDPGNVFSADTNRGAAPAGPGGGPEVRLEWVTDDKLIVAHHPLARVSRHKTPPEGVAVEYRITE